MDTSGKTTDKYTVTAVVNGVEQEASKEAVMFGTGRTSSSSAYLSIPLQDVVDRNGNIVFCSCGNHTVSSDVQQTYWPNDACLADVDGDGEV